MIRIAKYKWAVESAMGRLKRWKFLANVVSNTRIIFIGDNDQIVGSLINASNSAGDFELFRNYLKSQNSNKSFKRNF